MKVLLVRTTPQNIFAKLKTVRFEPLELEYLAAVVKDMDHDYEIYDGLIEKKPFAAFLENYRPDVVAISGYTIHVNVIKEYAQIIKNYSTSIKVIVGGIHAELNWQDFYDPNIDYIVHSNPVQAFQHILLNLQDKVSWKLIPNICYQEKHEWIKNPGEPLDPDTLPFPDRSHLRRYPEKFRYFGKEECALVKTAWGCPYDCNFCYCACLNGGRYKARDIKKVIKEIAEITQEKIFIIDDDFLVDRKRLLEFCQLISEDSITKDFSIYGRADLICAHEDILPKLKESGISEIIVGLEAVDDVTLNNYNKGTSAHFNLLAVKLLKENKIKSCGLFIVHPDYSLEDFRKLSETVKKMALDLCMFSIFTPLKGVPGYEDYQDKLIVPTDKYETADFLHLNLRPTQLSRSRFYFEFYKLYFLAYTDIKRLRANLKPIVKSLINLIRK